MPPAADLQVQPEPDLPAEALTDPELEQAWNDEVLIWGRDGWHQVARLCRFFKGHGMAIACPPSE